MVDDNVDRDSTMTEAVAPDTTTVNCDTAMIEAAVPVAVVVEAPTRTLPVAVDVSEVGKSAEETLVSKRKPDDMRLDTNSIPTERIACGKRHFVAGLESLLFLVCSIIIM